MEKVDWALYKYSPYSPEYLTFIVFCESVVSCASALTSSRDAVQNDVRVAEIGLS